MTRIAVIVVNYNTADLTVACVNSVLAAKCVDTLIVVDNASLPQEQAILQGQLDSHAQLIQLDKNYGFSLANNAGVRTALRDQPEWLIFLNSDTTLCPNAIENVLALGQDPTVGGIQMRLLSANDPGVVQLGPGTFLPVTGHIHFKDVNVSRAAAISQPVEVNCINGGAMAIRASAFLEVGMFPDDLFMYAEDVELSLRLRRAGWRLLYQPAAEVLHHSGASGGGYMSPFSIYHSTLSMWRVVRRNFSLVVYALYLAYMYLWFLPAFTAYCVLCRRHLVKPFLKAYLDHLRRRPNTPPTVTCSMQGQ